MFSLPELERVAYGCMNFMMKFSINWHESPRHKVTRNEWKYKNCATAICINLRTISRSNNFRSIFTFVELKWVECVRWGWEFQIFFTFTSCFCYSRMKERLMRRDSIVFRANKYFHFWKCENFSMLPVCPLGPRDVIIPCRSLTCRISCSLVVTKYSFINICIVDTRHLFGK